MQITIRKATRGDGRFLARMADAATDGMAQRGWAETAGPGGDPIEVGARIAASETDWPSYATSWIAQVDDAPAGMLMGEVLPPEAEPMPPGTPAHLAPIFDLHGLAPDTFYIDILAVEPDLRGTGIGTRLLRFAERFAGPQGMSLIVSDAKARAIALYQREGYRETARRPILDPGLAATGADWMLMIRRAQRPVR